MEKKIFDIKELITLRQTLHKYPELSKKEYKTQKRIKDYLLSKNIPKKDITTCAETGLILKLTGKGPSLSTPKKFAFRADIDGLPTPEKNQDLPYRSLTEASHLCGHDGHTTALLGGITLCLENISKLPSNVQLRFLFQPAEEKYGGAKRMIDEGALQDIQEVWGLHNIPSEPRDKVFCIEGPMVSGGVGIRITARGRGGHSSLKKKLLDPVFPLAEVLVQMERFLEELGEPFCEKIIASFPKFEGSGAGNCISDVAEIQGVCRFFDEEAKFKYLEQLGKVMESVSLKRGVVFERFTFEYPLLVNDGRLVKQLENVCEVSREGLPIKFSEDFSEFSKVVPGCFFLYSIGNPKGITLHDPEYDFNDECLENMARLWWKIIQDRCKE